MSETLLRVSGLKTYFYTASGVAKAVDGVSFSLNRGEVLGIVLFVALWIAGLVLMGIVEHMKRKYDLVTYRDILAYSRGEEPPRDGAAFARRHPVMMGWAKGIVSAIAGFVVAVVLCRIFLG